MTAGEWDRVKSIAAEALELPSGDWQSFLNSVYACEKVEVQREVWRLLSAAQDSGRQFLSSPPWRTLEDEPSESDGGTASTSTSLPLRFDFVREIGRGGMGVVLEAFDKARNLPVAIKALPELSASRWQAFKQEFQSLAAVHHPNLVCLYDFLRDEGQCLLSMELVRGAHFPHRSRGPCEPGLLRDLVRQTAEGIAAIHAAGILHRDVKPANVLVTEDQRVVIVDFGLAGRIECEGGDAFRLAAGTPGYMAPETLRGEVGQAADWFGLGKLIEGALPEGDHSELAELCRLLLEPDPRRRANYEVTLARLGAQPDQPGSANGESPDLPFVGREQELDSLEQAYESSRSGSRGLVPVLVSGGSGYGKSRLIAHFLSGLGTRHPATRIVRSRCYQQESGPYKALDDVMVALSNILRGLAPEQARRLVTPEDSARVAALFPGFQPLHGIAVKLGRGDAAEFRRRAKQAIRSLFLEIARELPIVVWLDDLHWMDPESADLLTEVLRDPSPPLLLLCSFRPDAGSPETPLQVWLSDPRLASDAVNITVGPLGGADAALLAERLLGTEGGDGERQRVIDRIVTESEGVPFLLGELTNSREGAGGRSIADLVWERLSQLDPKAQGLMLATSLAGQPINQEFAYAAAGLDARDPRLAAQLVHARLLRVNGPAANDTLEPMHDRIRGAIQARMPSQDKTSGHRKLAEVMARSEQADSEVVAAHFEQGDVPARASTYYERAAHRANDSLAFHRAAKLFEKAIRLGIRPAASRAALNLSAAEALANDGRSREASFRYAEAASDLPATEGLKARALGAYHLCSAGSVDEGRQQLTLLLRGIGKRIFVQRWPTLGAVLLNTARLSLSKRPVQRPHRQEALAEIDLVWYAAAGVGTWDLLAGFELLLYNVLQAWRAGEPERLVRALAFHAAFASMAGQTKAPLIRRNLTICAELAQQIGMPPNTRAWLSLASGIRAYNLGFWSQALASYESAEQVLTGECRGMNWELSFARAGKLWSLIGQGAVRRLHDEAREIIADGMARGDLASAVNAGSLPLPYALVAYRDEPSQARETVQAWLGRWTAAGYGLQHACGFLVTVWSLLYEDRPEEAQELVAKQWPDVKRSGILGLPTSAMLFWETRARIALACARRRPPGWGRSSLVGEARRALRILRKSEAAPAKAFAWQIEAALKAATGDQLGVGLSLKQALAAFRECEMPLHVLTVVMQLEHYGAAGLTATDRREAEAIAFREGIANVAGVARMHGLLPPE